MDSRLGASRLWVWGFVVVCVECKKVDREGYPVPLRVLAALLVLEPCPELERGSKAPRSRRGVN